MGRKPSKFEIPANQLAFDFACPKRKVQRYYKHKPWHKVDVSVFNFEFCTGEKKLMACVIQQAMDDILDKCAYVRREALDWWNSDNDTPFSFVSCCKALNWEPDTLRRLVKETRNENNKV